LAGCPGGSSGTLVGVMVGICGAPLSGGVRKPYKRGKLSFNQCDPAKFSLIVGYMDL
jgi:hypothetical protein